MKRQAQVLVLLLAMLMSTGSLFAAELPDLGDYQVILEGDVGQGGNFIRLEFATDGTVEVHRQFNGQNFTEVKDWTLDGDQLTIVGAEGDQINEFEGASMRIVDEKTIAVKNAREEFDLLHWNRIVSHIHIWGTVLVLILLNELFRRQKWSGIFFFFILPVLLIPVWTSYGITYWFKWAKLYSVVCASCMFLLMRFTRLDQYKFAKMACALFLALNIAEAVGQDFDMGYIWNILNGIAGVLSIITCFWGWKEIHADDSPEKDMVWPGMTVLWIIAYDVWNYTYVYLNFPGSATTQLMVLIAATIPALFIKKGTWLQARGFTLAAWFMYYFTFEDFYAAHLVVWPRNDFTMLSLSIISIVLNIACAVVMGKAILDKRKAVTA